MSIEIIDLNNLYFPYKEDLVEYYDKYFAKDGNVLNFKNHPLTIFAKDYVRLGKRVLDNLDDHVFIKYEYDRYRDADTVKNNTHKHNATKRIMNLIDSIKKYGYCEGRFNHSRFMIRVNKVFKSPYGDNENGYTLKTRKHRAAACIALGIKNVKVRIVN